VMTFDEDLVQQVKRFQLKMGLVTDGIVGAQTLIYLNSAAGLGVPKLEEIPRQPSTAAVLFELNNRVT
jgi:murein L,D-transpeptidase YcbB/YkuD